MLTVLLYVLHALQVNYTVHNCSTLEKHVACYLPGKLNPKCPADLFTSVVSSHRPASTALPRTRAGPVFLTGFSFASTAQGSIVLWAST